MNQTASRRDTAAIARREAILDAAKSVFFEEGYQLASMDRIAERAATTKRTVYDHFGAKEALFGAVVERGCRNVVAALPGPESLPADPRVGLALSAKKSVELMASPNCIRLQRLVAAEAERHPAFAATMRGAMAAGEAKLAGYLAIAVETGRLKPHDTTLAARTLSGAIAHAVSLRGLFGAAPDVPAVDQAVALYLDRYAA